MLLRIKTDTLTVDGKRIRFDALQAMLIICTFAYSFIILQL